MTQKTGAGKLLARRDSGKFRVVSYDELRSVATRVAIAIADDSAKFGGEVVISPILMGGGPPARLILDVLLGLGMVRSVVPCQISSYTAVGQPGYLKMTLKLSKPAVKGRVVIGIDDLVDDGRTLEAFRQHAQDLGAAKVLTAVIFSKPHSRVQPDYCGVSGVTEWLVMPGEELDFMSGLIGMDQDLASLSPQEQAEYFRELGLPARVVSEWAQLVRGRYTMKL